MVSKWSFPQSFRNIPHIHLHEKRDNKERWRGADIQVVIEGNWTTYRVCDACSALFCLVYLDGGQPLSLLFCLPWFNEFSGGVGSPRYCIICVKWLLLPLMLNFFSSLYQMHLSMLSLLLTLYFLFFVFLKSNLHLAVKISLLNLIAFPSPCSKNVTIRFARRTDIMPPVPVETKYHPSAVDLLLIKRLISETPKENLLQFLQHEFVNLGKSYAERLIGKNCSCKFYLSMGSWRTVVWLYTTFIQLRYTSLKCLPFWGGIREVNLMLFRLPWLRFQHYDWKIYPVCALAWFQAVLYTYTSETYYCYSTRPSYLKMTPKRIPFAVSWDYKVFHLGAADYIFGWE